MINNSELTYHYYFVTKKTMFISSDMGIWIICLAKQDCPIRWILYELHLSFLNGQSYLAKQKSQAPDMVVLKLH